MTLREAMDEVRSLMRGVAVEEDAIRKRISELDGKISMEILLRYEGYVPFAPYSENDGDRELLVSAPYESIYVYYAAAHMHLLLSDVERYNIYISLFEDAYRDLEDFCARTMHTKALPRITV